MLSIFAKIWAAVKSAFTSKTIRRAVEIVQRFKTAVDNPEWDLLVALTPTAADDAALRGTRIALAYALKALKLLSDAVKPEEVTPEQLRAAQERVKTMPPAMRSAVYHRLASLSAQKMDSDLDGPNADLKVQAYYTATR